MTIRKDEVITAVLDELRAAGITDRRIEPGGRHARVTFTLNGQRRTIVTPRYAGNWNSRRYARADARRLLRQSNHSS